MEKNKFHPVKKYLKLSEFAKTFDYGPILSELRDTFSYLHNKQDMDDTALNLQICVKKSRPNYLHGYVLTSCLYQYLVDTKLTNINILETGTARGFSSIMMSKILHKFNVDGQIITLDRYNTFDNCLLSSKLQKTVSIHECLNEWKHLKDKYIKLMNGDSNEIIDKLDNKIKRINFAFLDGAHYYKDLKHELDFTEKKQQTGDIIVCDDYTKTQFPEIVKAIDEFLESGKYESKIFYSNDGTKKRGYVYMKKK